jgi:DNA-binding LacI/PurR family transcriptional regulator
MSSVQTDVIGLSARRSVDTSEAETPGEDPVGEEQIGIKQVAEAAGVSVTTVSHALNGKGRLNEETRRRVREVAQRLGYRPNALARSLAGGRTGLIGLAISASAHGRFAFADFAYYAQLMSAAGSAALDRGYALVLASGAQKRRWRGVRLDGAFVVDPSTDDPLCREFRAQAIPLVTNGREPGTDGGYWVDNDHPAATRAVLDHLVSRGARRVGLVTSPAVNSYTIDARAGYETWCASTGQEPLVAVGRDLSERSGYDASLRLLRTAQRPDAIYATLDWLALGAMRAAREQGLAIPRDVMIAGCTDSDAGRWARPSLTALALEPDRIAKTAIALLADLIDGREPEQPRVLVPTRIIARASTRRTAASGRAGAHTTASAR